ADIETVDIPTLTYGVRKALVTAAQKREVMDSFDVFYVTKIMATLLPFSDDNPEVATLLVNMVSNVSSLSPEVLSSAQMETRSPARMVMMLEAMGQHMQPQPQPEGLYPLPVAPMALPPQQVGLWSGASQNVLMVIMDREETLNKGVSCVLEEQQSGSSVPREDKEDELKQDTTFVGAKFSCRRDVSNSVRQTYGSWQQIPVSAETHVSYRDFVGPSRTLSWARGISLGSSRDGSLYVRIPAFLGKSSKEEASGSVTKDDSDKETATFVDIVEDTNDTLASDALNNSSDAQNASVSLDSQDAPLPFIDAPSDGSSISKPLSLSLSSLPVSPQDKQARQQRSPLSTSSGFVPSFSLTEEQLAALNISSKYFSKFPSTLNISSSPVDLPSSSFTPKHLFPFSASSVILGRGPDPPRRKNVYLLIYSTGRLFPVLQSDLGDPALRQGNWTVISPVVGVSLGDQDTAFQNLSEPIVLTFKVLDPRRPLKVAFFDFSDISDETCYPFFIIPPKRLSRMWVDGQGDRPVVLRPGFQSQKRILRTIGIPKKVKHAVINLCLSTLLMLGVFIAGINRTNMELPCQIAGICIHYFTLCAVFWITLTSNIIYKKFLKASQPPEPPPELGPMPLPPKPILQFYFVGYGVPLIICGITAAVNLHFYAGMKYCFLEWEPSLGAFYAPVAILVAWNLVLFMRISCVVRSTPDLNSEGANESEQEFHTNEIELTPSQPDTITTVPNHRNSNHLHRNNNNHSPSHQTSNGGLGYRGRFSRASTEDTEEDAVSIVSIPDQERRPITQLRSLVAILFLFIVMWMCGALAIAKPFHRIIPAQELIFSYAYGIMSTLFGLFLVLYFCVTRKDWRLSGKRKFGLAPPETYTTPMEVTEPSFTHEETVLPAPVQANGNVIKSNSNTNLSMYSQKSSNITKAYNMKNNSKQSNINLVIPNASEISFGSTQESYPNFYNPRQNGAAKKFWQKHRHHSKIMNKDINRDLNSSLTDNNSVSDLNQHERCRRPPSSQGGTSSDANTHLSIEIQIQAKDIPVHINNNNQHSGMNGSSCGAISLEHNHTKTAVSRSSITPEKERQLTSANLPSQPSSPHLQSQQLQQLPQQRSPSTNSLGTGVHPSAFTPVQPRSSTNLAGQQQPAVDTTNNINQGINGDKRGENQREGSVPRTPLQAKDLIQGPVGTEHSLNEPGSRPPNPGVAWNPYPGHHLPPLPPSHQQQHAYTFTPPPPAHTNTQMYGFDYPPSMTPINPHVYSMSYPSPAVNGSMSPSAGFGAPPIYNIPPSPYVVQPGQTRRAPVQSRSPVSCSSQSQANHRQHHRRRSSGHNSSHPLSGGDSSDSSKPRQKGQQESNSSPGRSVTYAEHSPVASDSQAYAPQPAPQSDKRQPGKAHSVDSDHHSDPTHRKKHHRTDRMSKNKLANKQRSLGWDEQFKGRPSKVSYVYVNHMYRDKVMHKLIKQASESDELASKAFWLPRSASEYERLTQKGFCNMAEDTSSSSDEDSLDDNVWIKQSSGSDFHKKETSV
ncbi:adhesion G protein-coupled receptor A3, partial [Elysia marginata]